MLTPKQFSKYRAGWWQYKKQKEQQLARRYR
jgi:hypothetical protein